MAGRLPPIEDTSPTLPARFGGDQTRRRLPFWAGTIAVALLSLALSVPLGGVLPAHGQGGRAPVETASAEDAAAPEIGLPYRPGLNLIQVPEVPFTHSRFPRSLSVLQATGAESVALVPFLWQPDAASTQVGFGDALSDEELRTAIAAAQAADLEVFLKPHVWIDGTWAGEIDPGSLAGWERWVARYLDAIRHYAVLAEETGVDRFAIGTEIVNLRDRRLWQRIVEAVRAVYSGEVTYVAQSVEELVRFPAWDLLDVASVSLYEPLPLTDDPAVLAAAMARALDRLEIAQASLGMPILVAELGLMSARDAHVEPWLSPEQRPAAEPDQALQARILGGWLRALADRSAAGTLLLDGVYVWRWFSDPEAGGGGDIDFTVQNKLAAGVLACHWRGPACPAP